MANDLTYLPGLDFLSYQLNGHILVPNNPSYTSHHVFRIRIKFYAAKHTSRTPDSTSALALESMSGGMVRDSLTFTYCTTARIRLIKGISHRRAIPGTVWPIKSRSCHRITVQ